MCPFWAANVSAVEFDGPRRSTSIEGYFKSDPETDVKPLQAAKCSADHMFLSLTFISTPTSNSS